MSGLRSEREDIEEIVRYTEDRAVSQVELFFPCSCQCEYYHCVGSFDMLRKQRAGLTSDGSVDPLPSDLLPQTRNTQSLLQCRDHLRSSPLYKLVPILRRFPRFSLHVVPVIPVQVTGRNKHDDAVFSFRSGSRVTGISEYLSSEKRGGRTFWTGR